MPNRFGQWMKMGQEQERWLGGGLPAIYDRRIHPHLLLMSLTRRADTSDFWDADQPG